VKVTEVTVAAAAMVVVRVFLMRFSAPEPTSATANVLLPVRFPLALEINVLIQGRA
jgi:hypothetical protein